MMDHHRGHSVNLCVLNLCMLHSATFIDIMSAACRAKNVQPSAALDLCVNMQLLVPTQNRGNGVIIPEKKNLTRVLSDPALFGQTCNFSSTDGKV